MRFAYQEKGSTVLRKWNEARQAEKQLRAMEQVQRAGGFAGAAVNRLTASMSSWSNAINADLENALPTLRARARFACANHEHGKRFLSLVAKNIVGSAGPTLQVRAYTQGGQLDEPANNAVEFHYAKWSRHCDIAGRQNLAQMLRTNIKAVARDGEGLIRRVAHRSLPYGVGLQLLESDRIDESLNGLTSTGNMIRMGVEITATGRPVAVHVRNSHPGDARTAFNAPKVERVPMTDILHVFLPDRAEQVRGVTWLHAVLLSGSMLQGFIEAAVIAARLGASKVGVWTQTPEAVQSAIASLVDGKSAEGVPFMNVQAGEFIKAPAGYKLESWDPDYPHENFENFVRQCLMSQAAGLDVAAHNLTGDMRGVNFSSARIAEVDERDCWTVLQDWHEHAVMMRIYEWFLESALTRGDIRFPESGKALPAERLDKFLDGAEFVSRTWDWVDPQKDAQANSEKLRMNITSRTRLAAERGVDFPDVVKELAAEKKMLEAAGLSADLTPTGTPAKPATPAKDEDDE